MATVNVTVGMTPEMLADIDEMADKLGISRARLIRVCVRNETNTPFDPADIDLTANDDDAAEAQTGAA